MNKPKFHKILLNVIRAKATRSSQTTHTSPKSPEKAAYPSEADPF